MSLTTLATVKAFKNVTGTGHDAELARLIALVDQFCREYCNRALEPATFTEYHSLRAGQPMVLVKNPPVASITTIHDDPDRVYGADTLLVNNTDYVLENEDAGLVRFDEHSTTGGIRNLKIVYVGGFAAGSGALKLLEEAAIELVWLTRDLGDKALLGVQSKSIADGSITTYQRSRLDAVREILDAFRLTRV
jgi:hypothetical protein